MTAQLPTGCFFRPLVKSLHFHLFLLTFHRREKRKSQPHFVGTFTAAAAYLASSCSTRYPVSWLQVKKTPPHFKKKVHLPHLSRLLPIYPQGISLMLLLVPRLYKTNELNVTPREKKPQRFNQSVNKIRNIVRCIGGTVVGACRAAMWNRKCPV